MKKLSVLVVLGILTIGCNQQPNCERPGKYVNKLGDVHRELGEKHLKDSS